MGTFSSSANAGDLLGTGVFAIVILTFSGSWATVTFATSVVMAAIACLFALFGRENPEAKYQAVIAEGGADSDKLETDLVQKPAAK